MQSNHHPEKITYPAHKMIPVEALSFYKKYLPNAKKYMKRDHTRASRRYLKQQLKDEVNERDL
jgi:hypothetical protein